MAKTFGNKKLSICQMKYIDPVMGWSACNIPCIFC